MSLWLIAFSQSVPSADCGSITASASAVIVKLRTALFLRWARAAIISAQAASCNPPFAQPRHRLTFLGYLVYEPVTISGALLGASFS
jgi:hypothetical protein